MSWNATAQKFAGMQRAAPAAGTLTFTRPALLPPRYVTATQWALWNARARHSSSAVRMRPQRRRRRWPEAGPAPLRPALGGSSSSPARRRRGRHGCGRLRLRSSSSLRPQCRSTCGRKVRLHPGSPGQVARRAYPWASSPRRDLGACGGDRRSSSHSSSSSRARTPCGLHSSSSRSHLSNSSTSSSRHSSRAATGCRSSLRAAAVEAGAAAAAMVAGSSSSSSLAVSSWCCCCTGATVVATVLQ